MGGGLCVRKTEYMCVCECPASVTKACQTSCCYGRLMQFRYPLSQTAKVTDQFFMDPWMLQRTT